MQFEHLCMGCMSEKGTSAVCPQCHWKETATPASQYHLPPRTFLNHRYLVGTVLKQGKFGITYLAYDAEKRRKVVVKEFLPKDIISRFPGNLNIVINDIKLQPDFSYSLSKFSEETAVLRRIKPQPGLAHTSDFFRENKTAYRVMEYIEGVTLTEYLQRHGGKISFRHIIKLLTPLMSALEKIHGRGLLHFDLYPNNILITEDQVACLINFSGTNYVIARRWKILRSVVRQGYSPQELCLDIKSSGPWSDIYSLAATIYRALTGQVVPDSLNRIKRDTLVPPSQFNRDLSPEIENHLLRALAVHPAGRFKGMRTFKEAILKTWYEKERRTEVAAIDPFKKIHCSFCGTTNEVLTTDLLAGTVACFGCHRALTETVIDEVIDPLNPDAAPQDSITAELYIKAESEPIGTTPFAKIECNKCHAENEVLASDLGTVATCLICGTQLDSPDETIDELDIPGKVASKPPAPAFTGEDMIGEDDFDLNLDKPADAKVDLQPDEKRPPVIPRIDKTDEFDTPFPEASEPGETAEPEAQETISSIESDPDTATLEIDEASIDKFLASLSEDSEDSDKEALEPKPAPDNNKNNPPAFQEDLSDISIPTGVFDVFHPGETEEENEADVLFNEDMPATNIVTTSPDANPVEIEDDQTPQDMPPAEVEDISEGIFNLFKENAAEADKKKDEIATEVDDNANQGNFVTPTKEEAPANNKNEWDEFPIAPGSDAPSPPMSESERRSETTAPPQDKKTAVKMCPICNAENMYDPAVGFDDLNCHNCHYKLSATQSFVPKPPALEPEFTFDSGDKKKKVLWAIATILILAAAFAGGYFIKSHYDDKAELQAIFNRHLLNADQAFAGGDYAEALRGYQDALEFEPENELIQQKISQCDAQLIEIEKTLEAEILTFLSGLDQADSLYDIRQYKAARGVYDTLLQSSPGDPYITEKIADIDRFLAPKPVAGTPPPVNPTPLSIVEATSSDNLQDIIDNALPNSIIHLAAGMYEIETPVVVRKSVELKGAGQNRTIFIGKTGGNLISLERGVRLSITEARFDYESEKWGNILVVENAAVNINQCYFKGAIYDKKNNRGGSAILFSGNGGGNVSDSRFVSNEFAIQIENRAKPTIENNEIRGNKVGFQIKDESRPIITGNNVIENNGNGIAIYGKAQPKITGNMIRTNEANGLYFSSTNFNGTIRKNEILNNRDYGVLLASESRPTLDENVIKNNGQGGLQYKDQSRGIVRKNQIQGNKFGGVKIVDSAKPTLTQNKIFGNQGDGVEILDKAQPTINGNEILKNRGDGISLLLNEPGGLLKNNICTGNRGYGISILKPARPVMADNNLRGNNEGGMYEEKSAN